MDKYIPLSIPNFEGNEKRYVDDALEQGWVSTGGAYITRFEKELARFLSVDDVAACQSGTAAIHLSLIEAGVGAGDIVIVPPLTFIAAVNPVRYQSAEPVFIDCDDSFCMDPIKLRAFCEEECRFDDGELIYKGKHVKALVVVHVFGNLADMVSIMDTAGRYGLKVVEDATEALGSRYVAGPLAGKYAGTIGDLGAFSFNGNKIITTGGGGAITAKRSGAVEHIRYLSTQAKNDPHYYIHDEIGYNYRMTNLQAALGVAQMEELPDFVHRKQMNYERYKELFEGYELARLVGCRGGTDPNKWFYALEVDKDRVPIAMRDIITSLEGRGIQTRAIWGLINEQMPYRGATTYQVEKARYLADRILNLPCSTQITDEEIRCVVENVKEVLGRAATGHQVGM